MTPSDRVFAAQMEADENLDERLVTAAQKANQLLTRYSSSY
jgi:hypothetical protein